MRCAQGQRRSCETGANLSVESFRLDNHLTELVPTKKKEKKRRKKRSINGKVREMRDTFCAAPIY
jgi:hypothetical protein